MSRDPATLAGVGDLGAHRAGILLPPVSRPPGGPAPSPHTPGAGRGPGSEEGRWPLGAAGATPRTCPHPPVCRPGTACAGSAWQRTGDGQAGRHHPVTTLPPWHFSSHCLSQPLSLCLGFLNLDPHPQSVLPRGGRGHGPPCFPLTQPPKRPRSVLPPDLSTAVPPPGAPSLHSV